MNLKPSPSRHRHARAIAWSLGLIAAVTCADAAEVVLMPPGVMLQQGEWRGDVGTHLVPAQFEKLPAAKWPMDGWVRMSLDPQSATMTLAPLQVSEAKAVFKPILAHRLIVEQQQEVDLAEPSGMAEDGAYYVRVPGTRLTSAVVPLHRFKNGTISLTPELGYRFQLKLGDLPYAFTLQNGFRTPDGRPYGEGTQFMLEIGGQRFEYDLGGYGWDVRIDAIGDFDGDGRPDFLFHLGGSNSEHVALVLSSVAKPGKNAPTTYLTSIGC